LNGIPQTITETIVKATIADYRSRNALSSHAFRLSQISPCDDKFDARDGVLIKKIAELKPPLNEDPVELSVLFPQSAALLGCGIMDRRGKMGLLADYLNNLVRKASREKFIDDLTMARHPAFDNDDIQMLQCLLYESIVLKPGRDK
jgi:hypothetical protein